MELTTDWENSHLAALADRGDAARELLTLAADASSKAVKPSADWLASVSDFVDRVGVETIRPWLFEALESAVALSYTDLIQGINVYKPGSPYGQHAEYFTIFKGLLRMGQQLPDDPKLSRAVAAYEAHEAELNVVKFDWTLAPFASFAHLGPAWEDALRLAATVSGTKPSTKWSAQAAKLVESLGAGDFTAALTSLFAQATTLNWNGLEELADIRYRGFILIHWIHRRVIRVNDVLRGLLWFVPLLPPNHELTHQVAAFTDASLRKTDVGPLNPKCANAGVNVLGALESEAALGELARMASKVTYKVTLGLIEKALENIAERRGVTREELEELAAPTFGLTEVGGLTVALDGTTAVLRIVGSKVELSFITAAGKTVKAAPATVRAYCSTELAKLKALAKDIAKSLPAQTSRLDRMFINRRSWTMDAWRERYLDHPLVGTIARRLIWLANDVPVFWVEGALCTVDGAPVAISPDSVMRLWHPLGRPLEEVVAWRRFIEDGAVVQPFKQAHREVYLLTPAEERTATYSNRFAGHVLRQGQFHALATMRGWNNSLRVMADVELPPATRSLPSHGIRAEYWVGSFGPESEILDSGAFLHLGTDQVRFYPIDAPQGKAHAFGGGYGATEVDASADPLLLADVDPVVLSEVLQDIDLFVGVASVGGDPTWSDGGPQGRHQEYWQSYSFGDLSVTATQRRELLGRVVPRLAIADKCRVTDRFLEVDGTLRTYKIHLGSGNILMSPDDSYLCIVPSPCAAIKDPLQLPFDGDRTLSVILSKAAMLAADDAITDPSILSQIGAA